MADSDDARSEAREDINDRVDGGAPLASASGPGHDHDPGDSQGDAAGSAAAEAEREQERQLAEGTESPG